MIPSETISAFDAYLEKRQLSWEAVVIGGAALALMGVTSRPTRDCDVLDPELPEEIITAARDFARVQRSGGDPLEEGWRNNGPQDLRASLPSGWDERLVPVFRGAAVRLSTLGRLDLLRTKLFALCDRATDLPDCVALAPSAGELAAVTPWLEVRDLHPDWPAHVRATIADLSRRLGHGV